MEESINFLSFLIIVLIAVIVSKNVRKVVRKIVNFLIASIIFLIIASVIIGIVALLISLVVWGWTKSREIFPNILPAVGLVLFLSILPFLPKPIRDFFTKYYNQPFFTPSSKKCPSDAMLGNYANGLLFKRDAEPIKKHLLICEKCRKIAEEKQRMQTAESMDRANNQSILVERKISEKKLDIDLFSLNITSILLLTNVVGSLIFFILATSSGQEYGFYSSSRNYIFSAIIDVFLALNLLKRKLWAKQWIEVRAVFGGIVWLLVGIYQKDVLSALFAIFSSVALVAMLAKNFRWPRIAQSIGILAIIWSVCTGVYNVNLINTQNKIVREALAVGEHFFSSNQFHYGISVLDNWTIIQRKDFGKIDKSLEATEAEIILMSRKGEYFCLIIPEPLNGYGSRYGVEELKEAAVSKIREDKSMVLESSEKNYMNGRDGFEIHYYQMEAGQKRKYMTFYICYGEQLGINLTVWAFDQNAAKAFNEVKQIAENIQIEE